MSAKSGCGENGFLSSYEIMDLAYSDLRCMAASCGVDWDKLKDSLPQSHQSFCGRALPVCEAADSGKSFFIWYENTTRRGVIFPVLVFFSHRHGGKKKVFNGLSWCKSRCAKDGAVAVRSRVKLASVTASSNDCSSQNWRHENFRRFQLEYNRLSADAANHPYLKAKIGRYARQLCERMDIRRGNDRHGDYIATPLYRMNERAVFTVVGYQQIFDRSIGAGGQDRRYVMSAQGVKKGSFAYIHPITKCSRAGLAEGLATGLTIALYRSHAIFIAMDAGNLSPVAKLLHNSSLDVFSDNDCWKPQVGNTGLIKASEAVLAHGASQLYCPIFSCCNHHKTPTDFNDLLVLEGVGSLAAQLSSPGVFT